MSYSSGLYDTSVVDRGDHLQAAPPEGNDTESLHEAQVRKMDRLLDQTGVGEGSRVLEIGTGWGELAIRAAARGATVHSVTLSKEQLDLAGQRVAEAGYADQVTLELSDYRDIEGSYDAIVSVEMIEAVGHEFWSTYFRTIDRLLAPGGRVGIQAITMPHDRMLATRNTWTWINKYIFPGGFLPSVTAIDEVTRADTTLRLTDRLSFGQHYAETLMRWDQAFRAAGGQLRQLGFDRTFERMWHFYLEYSRAGFASGYIDVQQLTFTREAAVTTTESRSTVAPTRQDGVAQRLEAALRPFVGGDLPVRLRAWDGSEAGPSMLRSSSCARATPYAGCCGTPASSEPHRPTSPGTSRSTATSTPR